MEQCLVLKPGGEMNNTSYEETQKRSDKECPRLDEGGFILVAGSCTHLFKCSLFISHILMGAKNLATKNAV